MANLYNKAGLVNIPVGYQNGFLYNIKPQDNTLGFRFNRDSAATRVNKEGLIEQVGYFGPELVQNGDFSQLGPEEVVNGDFATDSDWNTSSTGISISGGKLSRDATATSNIFQVSSNITASVFYQITFEIVDYTSGTLTPRFGYNGTGGTAVSGVGTYTQIITKVDQNVIELNGTSFIGSIDNVSVKQVDPNDEWSLGTGWSIGNGKASCDGNQTSQTTLQSVYNLALGVGNLFKITFDISNYSSGQINLITLVGTGGPEITNINANGSYTAYSFGASTSDGKIQIIANSDFVGSIDNISVQEIQGDKPRIDYTDSLDSPSFLLEPQSTNLVTYSEDFDNASWNKFNSVGSSTPIISSNYGISPDGTQNADRIQVSRGSDLFDYSSVYKSITIPSSSRYSSVWLKSLSGTPTIVIGLVSQKITTEWVRYEFDLGVGTFTELSLGVSGAGYISGVDERADFLAWGYQLEAASYPTSYIPTAGSTATRAQETCTGAGNASTFNSTEGVLYAEIAALADDQSYRYITLSDGTNSNYVIIRYYNIANKISAFIENTSGVQGSTSHSFSPSETITDFHKVAFKWKANDFALWIDGTEVSTQSSGTTFSANVLNKLQFNEGDGSGNDFYGKTKNVAVFNEALTDDELQQLTGPDYNSFAALAAAYNYTII
jgi:hypothetical protein